MSYALVLNSGSSSIKFQLVDPLADATEKPFVSGLVEQIGEPKGAVTLKTQKGTFAVEQEIEDHTASLSWRSI